MRRAAALLAATAVLAACSSGEDASRFEGEVQRIRQAMEAGERDDALAAFGAIELIGLDAHTTGDLDDAEAQELARLVEQGRALVAQELPEPTTTTTTAAPPVVTEHDETGDDEERDEEWDEGKGRGPGKGKDGKGDD
jgi:hypothetical protein